MTNILNLAIALVLFLGITGGIIVLQIYLSRLPGKMPGLILPALCLLLTLVIIFGFSFFRVSNSYVVEENGETVQIAEPGEDDVQVESSKITVGDVLSLVPAFLMMNIPTLILLCIYFAARDSKQRSQNAELNRMNINDLS